MPGNRRQRRAELAGKAQSPTNHAARAEQVRASLGRAVRFHQAGKLQQAVASYEAALALDPNIPEALSNLALALKALGRADDAIARCEQALKLRPNAPEILLNLGMLLREKRRSREAAAVYRKALAVKPDDPALLSNLGNALKDQGEFGEAIDCFRQALERRPDYRAALSNLDNAIFDMHFADRYGNESTLEAARLFARHVEPARPRTDFANVRDPDRRLRVGYLSPDFRNHGVSYFFHGLVASLDPAEVEAYCYSNSTVDDDMTARIRKAAHAFRPIAGLSDAEAEAIIRRDRIDILVDLAGHTAGNRLSLFALKPAPVQMLTQGYLDTSGLSAMDYFVTDRWVVPPEDEGSFSENILRLPNAHFCFAPTGLDIPVTARAAGEPLTLGSFNNWNKVSGETLALWARVMAEIPDCRLFLKSGRFDDPVLRAEAIGQLAAHGVSESRLIVEGFTTREDLLAAYNRVDIGLDPFPYNGCTTTIEALWMGVPVVALRGKRSVARASEAILTVVGAPHLVAPNADAYVSIIKALAADRKALDDMHGNLRAMTENSPICDCQRFARDMVRLYRQMWRTWCAERPASAT
jgi:predicted O-linked N-acetylglucosamine transferase (SPINDLY family)